MTCQSYSGPGAQLFEYTVQTLLQRYRSADVSHAIVVALHRFVKGSGFQGMALH